MVHVSRLSQKVFFSPHDRPLLYSYYIIRLYSIQGNLTSDKAMKLKIAFLVYAVGAGYYAATRPNGEWKNPFSWHPFLMTVGMIGCMGIAAVTKKLGVSGGRLLLGCCLVGCLVDSCRRGTRQGTCVPNPSHSNLCCRDTPTPKIMEF